MKSLLSLCIAGVIGFCGEEPQPGPEAARQPVTTPTTLSQLIEPQGPRETLSGNYLVGQHAQRHQDWITAEKYMSRVLDQQPDNIDLRKRSMVLAMGAGEANRAIAAARQILKTEPDNVLALMFVALDAFRRQDYAETQSTLNKMPEGSMAEFIRPLLISWAQAGQGKFDGTSLTGPNPLYPYHALLIGDYLNKMKDVDNQIARLLQNPGTDVYALEKIGDMLVRHDMTDKALTIYKSILAAQPENEDIQDKIARLKDGKKLSDRTISRRVISPDQGAAEAMFDMARLLFREYSDDSALVFARMALHLNPGLTESRILLGSIMARHERVDDAIAYYNTISAEEAIYADARRQSAELLEQAERHEEAIALLTRLFEEKADIKSLIMIGDIYRRLEKYQEAVDAYNRAAGVVGTPIPEKYWGLLYSRGMAYERLGDIARAEDDLKTAIAFKPNHPYLLNYLGYSWVDQGKNLEESLKLIEQAIALRPDDGFIADSLGWAFYRMGQYDSAVTHLEGAAEMEPYDPVINDHLGDAYWQVGRKMEAQFQWNRALNHSKDEKLSAAIKVKLDEGLASIPAATAAVKEAKAVEPDTTSP